MAGQPVLQGAADERQMDRYAIQSECLVGYGRKGKGREGGRERNRERKGGEERSLGNNHLVQRETGQRELAC